MRVCARVLTVAGEYCKVVCNISVAAADVVVVVAVAAVTVAVVAGVAGV